MTLEELYRLLRSGHVQTQGIVDTLREPLVVLDRGFTVITANPGFYRTFNTEREQTIGRSLFELGDGQWDIPDLRKLLADVVPRAAAVVGYKVEHDFPQLGPRTMLISARQLLHPDDNSTQMLVVFEDVTARQKADAAKDMLVAETRHRMKNLMAMLRAVARQTEVQGRSAEDYRDTFMGRFEAVLSAQEVISASSEGFDLGTLVEKALQPVAQGRAHIGVSPAIELTQYQVQPMAMILHELTTNAVKYGALSNDSGLVQIGWNIEKQDGADHLLLDWREEGGPAVASPNRRGFGTKLIDYSARAEGGGAELDFDPKGLRIRITLPLGT